jgi:hypothetical protein
VGLTRPTAAPKLSEDIIPHSVDATLDRQIPSNGEVMPGVSISHGAVKVEETSPAAHKDVLANGTAAGKRKASLNRPDYADSESSDDEVPLVSQCCLSSK